MTNQHPETYEEALEDALDQAANLDQEKRERNTRKAKKTPAKKTTPAASSQTARARAVVLRKMGKTA